MRSLVVVFSIVPSIAIAQPAYAPDRDYREGLTVEGNAGLGLMWLTIGDDDSDQEAALGLGAGIGGWVSPQLAITARVANSLYGEDCNTDDTCTISSTVIGPHAQLWVNDQIFVGGGLGIALVRTYRSDTNSPTFEDEGLGLDLRAGFVFTPRSEGSLYLGVEYAPGFYEQRVEVPLLPPIVTDYTVHGFTIALGYQHM
jgi:hypothetical protein